MIRTVFAIPGDLSLPTGGYAYARHLLRHFAAAGVDGQHLALPAGYPSPTAGDLEETARLLAAAPADAVLLMDGLAFGAMPAALINGFARPIVALVHHPLCLEAGVPPRRAAELKALETAALTFARRIVVSSPTTARTLAADFGVEASRIHVAEPGTEPAPRSRGRGVPPLALLAVGSLVPRKGYDVLVEALRQAAAQGFVGWRLTIAGALDRSPETVEALRGQISEAGLEVRIALAGPMSTDDLNTAYAAADLFVMASHYEGYGMVLAEALARGLAIVTTTGGAAAETVPDAAAVKVPPGDAAALAEAIRRAGLDGALRARLADAAWAAGQRLPRWEDTTEAVADALKEALR